MATAVTDLFRAHDLLHLDEIDPVLTGAEPPWVAPSLSRAPWVVVRRSRTAAGEVAVGVRGRERHERYAMTIPTALVRQRLAPEDLRPDPTAEHPVDAVAAVTDCARVLDPIGVPWGPAGSVGFELATGVPTASATSDLDLVVRVDTFPGAGWAAALVERLSRLGVRVDAQVEGPQGAVLLAELAQATSSMVLRTAAGPRLIAEAALRP